MSESLAEGAKFANAEAEKLQAEAKTKEQKLI